MSRHLLDVNVLVALWWPAHEAHPLVQEWFRLHADEGWATCPLTQAGFVRVISNPSAIPEAVRPQEALKLLEFNLKHPGHQFWASDLNLSQAVERFSQRLMGYKQVTDAYLLGLVMHREGRLVSLDQGVRNLVTEKRMEKYVTVLA